MSEFRHASWLTESVRGPRDFRRLVDMCKGLLEPIENDFSVIVVTGLSGALVGPTVALEMGKFLVAVRKDESKHSDYQVEGLRGSYNYVILDDLMSTGKTVRRLIEAMGEHTAYQAKFIGVALYRYNGPFGGKFQSLQALQDTTFIPQNWDAFGRVI